MAPPEVLTSRHSLTTVWGFFRQLWRSSANQKSDFRKHRFHRELQRSPLNLSSQPECLETRTLLSGVSPPPAAFVTMVDNGASANRVDLVFLGDGYTASEIDDTYITHIETALEHFFLEGQDPFPRYQNFFNIHRIDVISDESGIDEPLKGITRDSALDGTYNFNGIERLVVVDEDLADGYLANSPIRADMRLVTVNSTTYGGSGGRYAVYAGGDLSSSEIALHEVGHSFAGLADEYFDNGTTYTGVEPSEPNVTKSSTGNKWSEWLGYEQPGIGTIGAYEGARYFENGLYRPSLNSKMNVLYQPFDAVSREAFIREFYELVNPVDAARSTSGTIGNASMLWADLVDPNVLEARWYVDDVLVPGATGATFIPSDFGVTSGVHNVRLSVFDPTDWVRRGRSALEQEFEWTVSASVETPALNFELDTDHLDLQEGGASDLYRLSLSAAPTANVTVQLESDSQLSASTAAITFTPLNWNIPQSVTVSAVSDIKAEGDQVGRITHTLTSTDARYNKLAAASLVSIVRDAAPPGGSVNQPPVVNDQQAVVSPGSVNGTLVYTVFGSDADFGQSISWSIVSGNIGNAFAIDEITGDVTVADETLLDPELHSQFVITVRATDNGAPSLSDTGVVTIRVTGTAVAPVAKLTLQSSSTTYSIRSSPVILDSGVTFRVTGGDDEFGGTQVLAKFARKKSGKDALSILSEGSGAGQISLSGNNVLYEGVAIGSFTQGPKKKALQLTVTFNAQATATSIQALLRRIAFNSGAKKAGAARTVQLQVSNYSGVDSETVSVEVTPTV